MEKKKSFLKQFWHEKKMVGAMAPSSRFLSKKMLKNVNFETAKVIIELGPGTGVFTDEILRVLHPDAILLVFELNDSFFEQLKQRITDKRVRLIHDSAEKMADYLALNNLGQADIVLSSLPLSNFPKNLRNTILETSVKSLKPNGLYIQFQYSLQSKKAISNYFSTIDVQFTPLNFPPAFVYTCKNS
jgi:phospholipid N-methyltransferase